MGNSNSEFDKMEADLRGKKDVGVKANIPCLNNHPLPGSCSGCSVGEFFAGLVCLHILWPGSTDHVYCHAGANRLDTRVESNLWIGGTFSELRERRLSACGSRQKRQLKAAR